MNKNMKKFISKNSNLRVVLSPGFQGERLTGRLPVAGMHVKFEEGVAIIEDPKWIEMMLVHPGFNLDFILAEEDKPDPYAANRKSIEPEHNVTEIKYGHVGENLNPKNKVTLSAENKALVTSLAASMAKEMLEKMLESGLVESTKAKAESVETAPETSQEKEEESFINNVIPETPVVETPVVETPVVETPVVETPVVETPVVETPVIAKSEGVGEFVCSCGRKSPTKAGLLAHQRRCSIHNSTK